MFLAMDTLGKVAINSVLILAHVVDMERLMQLILLNIGLGDSECVSMVQYLGCPGGVIVV